MMRAFLLALAMLFVGSAHANAQEDPTPQQYERLMQWAAGHQQIIQMVVAPLQQMPGAVEMNDRNARLAWVRGARSWVVAYRMQTQAARESVVRLGRVPEAGYLTDFYRRQDQALPEMIMGIETFINEFDNAIDSVERNDPRAAVIAAAATDDAAIIVLTQFRNLNALQAESIPEGPQRYLLRSFASSYEAMIALSRERRAAYSGADLNANAVLTVRTAADAMIAQSRLGRAAALQEETELPAQAAPEQGDFLRRVHQAYQTFAGSFAREEEIAFHLGAIADLMSAASSYAEIEQRMMPHLDRVSVLDAERLGDIQRRTQLIQAIAPPT